MDAIVELISVAARRGTNETFADITLAITAGERFALLGPSGCGKSTLLRLLAGLDAPTAGELRIGGRTASTAGRILLEPHERSLALVFQDLALWPNLTAYDNVVLGLAAMGSSARERHERAMEALHVCRIAELAERRPHELSGGQQQRVALARALAVRPKLLLLDEPFTSLDITTKMHLSAEIRRLCTELELTLILVSHDPLEARTLCSSAAVLEEGALKESGTLDALLKKPTSRTLRSFVEQLMLTSPGAL